MDKTKPDGLGAALKRAKTVAERLESATDLLNKRLQVAEMAIGQLRLGVEGGVGFLLDSDDVEPGNLHRLLSFGRFGDNWRLMVSEALDPEGNEYTEKPLLNCARHVRLAAVDLLPDLVQDLVETAERQIAEAEAKAEEVNEFIVALSDKARS
jgi:hypothetical protein